MTLENRNAGAFRCMRLLYDAERFISVDAATEITTKKRVLPGVPLKRLVSLDWCTLETKELGKFELGLHKVRLLASTGTGGAFSSIPDDGGLPTIEIGVNYKEWERVVAILMHEAIEFALNHMGCRFYPSCDVAGDHNSYLFVFDHRVFSEAIARASEFVSGAIPLVAEFWKNEQLAKSEG